MRLLKISDLDTLNIAIKSRIRVYAALKAGTGWAADSRPKWVWTSFRTLFFFL